MPDDIDKLYIETTKIKKGYKKTMNKKTIKVRSTLDVALDDYKKSKAIHKANIKNDKRSIKSHRLMIKQAKTLYKLVKLQEK